MKLLNKGFVLFVGVILLSSCASEKFSVEKATKQGDVINIHGKISNLDRFTQFMKDVEGHVDSRIRISQLTIEGDPIYYDLDFKKGGISYTYDNSEDKFGKKNIMKTVCTGIVSEKVERGVAYKLDGCKDTTIGQSFSFVVPGNGG